MRPTPVLRMSILSQVQHTSCRFKNLLSPCSSSLLQGPILSASVNSISSNLIPFYQIMFNPTYQKFFNDELKMSVFSIFFTFIALNYIRQPFK